MRQAARFRRSIALAATLLASAGTPAATPVAPVVAAAPASAAASASAPLSDACPAQLPVAQTVSQPIPGWTPLDQRGSTPFVRVALYPGSPADPGLSPIVPTIEYKGAAGLHDSWDLPHRADGYWMTCAYTNTTAVVTRKLADDADFCFADYDGRFLTLVVRHWACGARRTMALPAWTRPAPKGVKPAAKAATRRSG
jgi:hypothetical protein